MEMTKKKWLMIGAGGLGLMFFLLCSCGILITIVMYMGSWQSPGDGFRATLMSANAGKYADADNGLAEDMQKALRQRNFSKEMWDNETQNGQIATIEIHKEDVRGDGAFVQYTITYKNGEHTGTRLIKGPKGERLPGKRTPNPHEEPEFNFKGPIQKPPTMGYSALRCKSVVSGAFS
jgi:hypothetical protein